MTTIKKYDKINGKKIKYNEESQTKYLFRRQKVGEKYEMKIMTVEISAKNDKIKNVFHWLIIQ